LEGIDNLLNLIKNNKNILGKIKYNFIDIVNNIKLKKLFDRLNTCIINNINIGRYINNMEKIIKKLKCDNINYNEYGELFY
jgi:hypothetical protein